MRAAKRLPSSSNNRTLKITGMYEHLVFYRYTYFIIAEIM